MYISRQWAMPNKNTFTIKPIRELIEDIFSTSDSLVACDPFVNNSPFKDRCVFQNDIDNTIDCTSHMDAKEFLKSIPDICCDVVFFDHPYSPRQVSESYKKHGLSVNSATTQSSYWSVLKAEIARITKTGGIVVSCGWNSGGIGKSLGFEINKILLVPHGGWHNDTIITAERKR